MVAIINNCVDGVVPHSYMVTLTLPDHSDLGRPLDTKEKLSFLQDWVRQYTHEDTTNTAPTTAASSTPTPSHARATNYFTAIMFGVAVEAGDKVRHACNTPRAPMYSSTPVPAPSVPVSLYRRYTVASSLYRTLTLAQAGPTCTLPSDRTCSRTCMHAH
jgi:hypothetical protein